MDRKDKESLQKLAWWHDIDNIKTRKNDRWQRVGGKYFKNLLLNLMRKNYSKNLAWFPKLKVRSKVRDLSKTFRLWLSSSMIKRLVNQWFCIVKTRKTDKWQRVQGTLETSFSTYFKKYSKNLAWFPKLKANLKVGHLTATFCPWLSSSKINTE